MLVGEGGLDSPVEDSLYSIMKPTTLNLVLVTLMSLGEATARIALIFFFFLCKSPAFKLTTFRREFE